MFDVEIARVRSIPMALQRHPQGSIIHLNLPPTLGRYLATLTGRQSTERDVRFGSKAENLALRICCPLCRYKQTSACDLGRSASVSQQVAPAASRTLHGLLHCARADTGADMGGTDRILLGRNLLLCRGCERCHSAVPDCIGSARGGKKFYQPF